MKLLHSWYGGAMVLLTAGLFARANLAAADQVMISSQDEMKEDLLEGALREPEASERGGQTLWEDGGGNRTDRHRKIQGCGKRGPPQAGSRRGSDRAWRSL